MFFSKKRNFDLSETQKEILTWLLYHQRITAYSTWKLLFDERNSNNPDKCIAYYDSLSPKEKAEVELIISRYFFLYWGDKGLSSSSIKNMSPNQIIENLSYIDATF